MIEKKNPKHNAQWFENKYNVNILNYKAKKDDSSDESSDDESDGDQELDLKKAGKTKSASVVYGSNHVEYCNDSISDISVSPVSIGLISHGGI